ncbi:MAG: hypothetical protein DRP83_00105 [Planctomycetota bacterium]|nr:MAG: hypothetical protein DRP83_00105 [Planctomycetota bacterium]
MGHYLHKHRSDHTGCTIQGCQKDCCVELVATLKDGSRIYIPGCEKHALDVRVVKHQLENGVKPKDVRVKMIVKGEKQRVALTLSELYYCELGKAVKHRSTEKQEKLDSTRVAKNWRWIEDFDMWMNAAGKVVPLKKLDDKEIEDAVLLIRRVNIKRRTKRIRWIKDLEEVAPTIRYTYPEDELGVGVEEAYAKLDQFYEECRSRGILP